MDHSLEIAFIDPTIPDLDAFLSGLRPDVDATVLSTTEPAIPQIARALDGRENLTTIHLVAHGEAGEVRFASGSLSLESIDEEENALSRFGTALGAAGKLLVWACRSGAGARGAAFVETLAARTGVRVGAASGLVGSSAKGGSWILDRGGASGRVPLTADGIAAYAGVMATFTGTNGADVANATTGTLTGFSGGTVAQLQDNAGDTFTGGNGADTIVAGSGDDTINIANGQFVSGESINGGANTASGVRDQIVLTSSGTTVDFSVGSVTGIETLTGSSGNDSVTMTAAQWAGFSTVNLNAGSSDTLNVVASGNITVLATPTLSGIETGNLTGTSGTDVVTLTGLQLDAIIIGSGTINLGAGSGDTINLTSTSADLNTLGNTNASIAGVEIISASGASTGVTISLSGQTEAFTIIGSGQADTITGGSGVDTIDAGGGNDTVNVANGQFVAGESIQGGADSGTGARDQIVLTSNGTTVDFSVGSVAGVETLSGSGGNDTVTMTAAQWAGFSTINLGSGTSDVLHVVASGNITVLVGPGVSGVETGNLVGTSGTDTVTLSGAHLDAIIIGSGTINLGAGTDDTIALTSTSADLNTLGATDSRIQGVEAISAAGAAAGVTITLSGQSEGFAITGSNQADTITGGSGADTIVGGAGADVLNGGAGNDVITYDGSDISIAGGGNTDTLLVNGGATINLSSADQSLGDSANVTGFENVDASGSSVSVSLTGDGNANVLRGGIGADSIDGGAGDDTINIGNGEFAAGESIQGGTNSAAGTRDQIVLTSNGTTIDTSVGTISGIETFTGSTGNDTVTMTASQWAGLATINLANGTDVLNVLATGDISALATPSISNVETGNLVGTSGNDTVRLSGAQLNAILIGAGTINLGAGASDTINLTSTSTELNALGNSAVAGVEAISAAGATAGVTINLAAQTEAFTITGSSLADTLTGGTGADSINGGAGADVLSGGAGNDIVTYDGSDVSIAGGADVDTLVVNGAATINLSLVDQSSGDDAVVSGFENVDAGGSGAAVTLTGDGGANVLIGGSANDSITGGAGNDTIDGGAGAGDRVVFGGARADYTFSLSGATYTFTDTRSGSPDGTDTVTNVELFQFSDGTVTAEQLTAPPPGAPVPNKIALENMKQGNPESEWGIDGDGDYTSIQGFATNISTNLGGTVDFKIATDSTDYRIDIYRLGYYGGDGARKVATIQQTLGSPQVQPHPIVDMSRGLIDAGNWAVSASWQVPEDAVSGVYIAKLVRQDGTEAASHIPFIIRDDTSTSDIVFQTSDTTWQAYNAWGGASLYFGEVPVDPEHLIGHIPPNCGCAIDAIGRATAISYNRPIITNTSPIGGPHDFIFGAEHSAIRWLEQNGYDVSYISGVDTTRSGSLLLNHDAYLSVGHDEYWSAEQRANVEAARDAGVNLAFWSGNEIYWKVRWETSIDGSGTPYRTMVTYKETWGGTPDPSDIGTGTWRDPRFADPGQEPENSLTGQMFQVDSYRLDTITIPYEMSNLRFWRNTAVDDLQPGETFSLVKNLLGYEWDSDMENGFRPAGLINMSLSTITVDQYLRDYGTRLGTQEATHSLTMYRAESGALVFGAGTVFWSWGLDSNHQDLVGQSTPTDPNVQQAMVNMFADMGIQPTTLQASLIMASMSTDTIKPTSTITSPTVSGNFVEGQKVTITGTAQDLGGGIIAGVEISVDSGQSWWKATGRENWSYTWNVQASGTYTILTRAVDDSLNLETPSAGVQVTVNLPSTSSLWTLATKPTTETTLDPDTIQNSGVELGVRFQASTGGFVNGIRFYKGYYNIGSHTVDLWSSNGTLLATGVSTGESINGWHTVLFSSPVHISAGTTYVASYHSEGYWSANDNYFTTNYTNGPLTVLAGGSVYAYSDNPGAFPNNTPFGNTNYWVDVVFEADPNVAPVATDDDVSIGRNGTLLLSIPGLVSNDTDPNGDQLTITAVGGATNGSVSLDTQTGQVSFTPTADYSGPASFTYTVSDGRGGTDTGTVNVMVGPDPAGVSLFQNSQGPAGPGITEGVPVELGMKFTTSISGSVTGIRFYKPSNATGTHTGSLWSANGTLLATVTFTNESTSGWQTATFSNPIQITRGATYIASYHSNGTYVADANYFATSVTSGPVTAPSSDTSGGNGVYVYAPGTAFPTQSFQSANYWVDVVFNQSTVNTVPIANNDNGYTVLYNTQLSLSASALVANDTDSDADPLTVTGVGNATNGTVALDTQTGMVTFTPTSGYTGSASFTYDISDGRGGTATATVNMTVGQQEQAQSLFATTDTPSLFGLSDGNPLELGVKFTASFGGTIVGMRYYKDAQETGTHTGSLWSSNGTLLATATFTNESSSGWQTVMFSQPIEIDAGTTYVASYHSNGFYTATPDYFTSDHTSGSLTAPSSVTGGGNGLYAYGTGSVFPTASYRATNYWVDVLYSPSNANVAPVASDDPGFFTPYNTALTIQASTLLANDTDTNSDLLVISGVSNAVNGTVAFDSENNVVTFTPTTGYVGTASFTYTVSDGHGGTDTGQVSLAVDPEGGPQTLFSSSATPTLITAEDPDDVNLGMKFQSDVAGWITGFRFYKGPQNTGPHEGYLWTSSGTLLASATFTNETGSGWQSVSLSSEVAIEADTTYVVSYHSNGFYSATGAFFENAFTNLDLTAPASGVSGGNGLYAYGPTGLFPTNSFNASNYYVDVAFRPQLAA